MSGPALKQRLKALGISQRRFAREELGVSVSVVNRWATGELPVPRYAERVLELLEERAEIARRLTR